MTKGLKALVGVVLVFSLLISGVGYASLTDTLAVTGSASAEAPATVYIYDAKTASSPVATVGTFTNISYPSSTILSADSVTFDSNGKASIYLYVFNNTVEEYMYYGVNAVDTNGDEITTPGYTAVVTDPNKVEHDPNNKDSNNVVLDPDGTNYVKGVNGDKENNESAVTGAKIAQGTKHEGILLTLTGTPNSTVNGVYLSLDYRQSSFHNGWVKVEGVLSKFEEIIDAPSGLDSITEMMGDKGALNPTYTGNVAGSAGGDDAMIQNLFGGELDIDLDNDGDDDEVTVMIKAVNLDNDNSTGMTYEYSYELPFLGTRYGLRRGMELVLYITPAKLGNTDYVNNNDYVISYICFFEVESATPVTDANGNPVYYEDGSTQKYTYKWKQVGETMYEGVCQVNAYDGSGDGNDSINTETWRSTKTYYGITPAYTLEESYDYTGAINGTVVSGSNRQAIYNAIPDTATAQAFIVSKKEYL